MQSCFSHRYCPENEGLRFREGKKKLICDLVRQVQEFVLKMNFNTIQFNNDGFRHYLILINIEKILIPIDHIM